MTASFKLASVKKFTASSVFRTTLFASVIAAVTLAVPNSTNADKPTAKHFKRVVDDTAPPQAEPETVLTDGAAGIQPTSGPAISPSVTGPFAPVGPAWAAIGPTPIPNGQAIPADVNGISLTHTPA